MGKCHNPVPVTSLTHCSLLQWAVVAPSMSCLQAIRNTECLAMVLRGKAPTKWLHFYPPFCLTYSAASNVILCYSLFSLPLSHVSTPIHSFTFPHPLSLLSHYHSLVPWPGLVLTVLVSIRTLPLGCGPVGLPVSDLTELRFWSHFSLCSWWDFLQNLSVPDVKFPLRRHTATNLYSNKDCKVCLSLD